MNISQVTKIPNSSSFKMLKYSFQVHRIDPRKKEKKKRREERKGEREKGEKLEADLIPMFFHLKRKGK